MEISIKLLGMWQKAEVWDHILSKPVHRNFHRSASNVVKSSHMGSHLSRPAYGNFPKAVCDEAKS